MSQNIQDPELKDFVEESIIECFHYLKSNKREKCEFSQNLIKCLSEKGEQVSFNLLKFILICIIFL